MKNDIIFILDKNPDYWNFLRERTYWYRILSVDRNKIKDFLQEYKIVRRKRFIDKVEDASNLLTLVSTMMEE